MIELLSQHTFEKPHDERLTYLYEVMQYQKYIQILCYLEMLYHSIVVFIAGSLTTFLLTELLCHQKHKIYETLLIIQDFQQDRFQAELFQIQWS